MITVIGSSLFRSNAAPATNGHVFTTSGTNASKLLAFNGYVAIPYVLIYSTVNMSPSPPSSLIALSESCYYINFYVVTVYSDRASDHTKILPVQNSRNNSCRYSQLTAVICSMPSMTAGSIIRHIHVAHNTISFVVHTIIPIHSLVNQPVIIQKAIRGGSYCTINLIICSKELNICCER